MEESRGGHLLTLQNREELSVSGVQHVVSYDDREILLETRLGKLVLRGEGLAITHLDVQRGELAVRGLIIGLVYTEQGAKGKNIWHKLLK